MILSSDSGKLGSINTNYGNLGSIITKLGKLGNIITHSGKLVGWAVPYLTCNFPP